MSNFPNLKANFHNNVEKTSNAQNNINIIHDHSFIILDDDDLYNQDHELLDTYDETAEDDNLMFVESESDQIVIKPLKEKRSSIKKYNK